jgi:hypothetical protein
VIGRQRCGLTESPSWLPDVAICRVINYVKSRR